MNSGSLFDTSEGSHHNAFPRDTFLYYPRILISVSSVFVQKSVNNKKKQQHTFNNDKPMIYHTEKNTFYKQQRQDENSVKTQI